MPTEETRPHAGTHTKHATQRTKKLKAGLKAWRAVGIIMSVLVLVLGGLLYLAGTGRIFGAGLGAARLTSSDANGLNAGSSDGARLVTVICVTPVGEPIVGTVEAGGAYAMPDGPEIAGYTFLGWADADGMIEKNAEITPFEDTQFSARYAIAFRDESAANRHEPYMNLDDALCFHPNGGISRGETVEIIYSLLDTEVVGSGKFADVERDASYYKAAATLKDLGVIDGSRLHPDENITYGEFFQILSAFFPAGRESCEFELVSSGDGYYPAFCLAQERGWLEMDALSPNDELRRAEAAHVFNILCGRTGTEHDDLKRVGTISDVSLRDEYFSDIAEAVIPHECTHGDGGESWSSSTPLELRGEGFFFIGTALHRIDSQGSALVNESYGSFDFGSDGVITFGNDELDAIVQEKLRDLIDPETMSREEMLKTLYNFVTYKLSYLRGNFYEIGETGWERDEALHMLTAGKGNCYSFAAAFWALGRSIGYDVVCYSGTVGINFGKHGWTEIEIDGTTYIFDPALENEEHFTMHRFTDLYMKTYESVAGWTYKRTA